MWNVPQPPPAADMSLGFQNPTDIGSSGDLVEVVKTRQRSDPHAKEQWHAFVDLHGNGMRDPAKHTQEFLQGFLDHLSSGVRLAIGQDQDLSMSIKALQRKSPSVKHFWGQFCMMVGGGLNDPAKHGGEFHVKFFDALAGAALQGMGGEGANQHPMKRMRDNSGMGHGMGMGMGAGGTPKDNLVNRIKSFQRMSEPAKDLWNLYADTYLGGIRDPGRHEEQTLHEFCANHNVPQAAPMAGGPAAGTGVGDDGCGTMGNLQPVQANTPEQDMFVQKVKNYTRTSPEAKEAWCQFAGKTRDPARHPVSKLQEFCTMYSVM